MTYAILSDVHANDTALRRVLDDAKACGAGRFVCLGDVVGYGPAPEEAVGLLRAIGADVVAGNHDAAVTGRLDPKDFTDLAEAGVRRHRAALSRTGFAWLKSLPLVLSGEGFVATHGSFVDPPAFDYVENAADAAACFDATEAPLAFVGHTHVPQIFVTGASGNAYRLDPADFALEDGKRYIVNPGSVGFPREKGGVCRSSYVLYDSVRRTVTFRFLPFAVESVMSRGGAGREGGRRRSVVAAGLGLVLAAALGAVAFLFVPARVAPPAPAQSDTQLVVTSATWSVSTPVSRLLPGLELARNSSPVSLKVRFTDAQGNELTPVVVPSVKRSRKKPFAIPKATSRIELIVLKARADDSPRITAFAPTLKP